MVAEFPKGNSRDSDLAESIERQSRENASERFLEDDIQKWKAALEDDNMPARDFVGLWAKGQDFTKDFE